MRTDVDAGRAHLRDGARGVDDVRRRGAVPLLVGHGVGEQVLAVVGPEGVGVLGAEDVRRPGRGQHREARLAPGLAAGGVVGLLERGVAVLGLEVQAEPGGALGGRDRAAAVEEERVRLRVRRRRHPHAAPLVLELLAGPGLQQHPDPRLEVAPARRHGSPEQRVLLGPVAQADRVADPTGAEVVEDREVLGQAQRLVEVDQQRADRDRDPRGHRRHRRRDRHRRGQVAVVGGVVLGEHQRVEAGLVDVRRLLERAGVERLPLGGVGAGRPEVVADDELGAWHAWQRRAAGPRPGAVRGSRRG